MHEDQASHYKSTEFDTGKKWAGDNKAPIYRKTVSFGTLPNAGAKTVAHGLTAGTASGNMDISKHARVVEVNSQDPDAGPPALSLSEQHLNVTQAAIIGDNISITTDADLTAYTQTYVTIEYCKVA